MIKYFIFILISLNFSNALRFNSSSNSSHTEPVINLRLTSSSPNIDVYKGEQIVVIKDLKTYSYQIIISCFISGYNSNSKISYSFCKEDSDCAVTIKDGESFKDRTTFSMTANVDTVFDNKGMKLTLYLPSDTIDISGNYYCRVVDETGNFMIRSNNIQIRDQYFWEQNLVKNNDDSKIDKNPTVTRDKTPVTYQCSANPLIISSTAPRWVKQEFQSPVKWSICPVKNSYETLKEFEKQKFSNCKEFTHSRWQGNFDKAIKPMDITEMKKWTYYVSDNGDLNIFDIKLESSLPQISYALMCYTKRPASLTIPITAISTYILSYNNDDIVSGVVFNATLAIFTQPLKAISPLEQNVEIYKRQFASTDNNNIPVSIFAKFYASSSATAQWTYNNGPLNSGSNIIVDRFKVNFIRDITSEMAGKYTLTVTDGANSISMIINVAVLGAPTIANPDCMPTVKHVWEHDGVGFSCNYKDRPNELKISINQQEIKLGESLSASRSSLSNSYPHLTLLNFTISPTSYIPSETVTLTYTVYNLQKTQGQSNFQDHNIMFFVQNKFGLSVKSSSIYTVPRLRKLIIISPEMSNCTAGCSSLNKHIFKCQINTEPYDNKELIIDQYWTINEHRLEQNWKSDNMFAPYFNVDPVSKELTMEAIKSNDTNRDNFVKNALKDNHIICNLDLLSLGDITPIFSYNSNADNSLGNVLKARITLDYTPLNTAYIYWIVAVILALIILLILIVLLTRYCMRNKGETYPLDKIEREHGLDPEKEVQDELFKPYEREDHDPEIIPEGRRLSLTEHSVGSADDGELDNYELDPSNFNEDGSIIGEYKQNPRNRVMS